MRPRARADVKDSDILVDQGLRHHGAVQPVLNSFASARRIEQIDLKQDDATRVVIITGRRAFCGEIEADSKSRRPKMGTVSDWVTPILETKPVIAAVNGPAVGAGLGFALDIRVASDKARPSSDVGMLAGRRDVAPPPLVGTSRRLR